MAFNVSIDGSICPRKATVTGVPQGAVLGLILFMLNVSHLPDLLQGEVLLFADDVKLISARASFDDLQDDLHTT